MNHFILAPELRVLNEKGEMVGLLTKSEALQKAQELEVDLVEIAPNAKPPVAKLIEFSKFKYQQKQKLQDEKKKAKISEIKELRLTPVMAQGDFDLRVRRARAFLEGGDKVRFVVKSKGRMNARRDIIEKIALRAIDAVSDCSAVEIAPKQIGKIMMAQLTPVKKAKVKKSNESTQV
ncbi:MAG: Translation initiation factor IF-3 [Microgenomates group bacterium GW2011_GWF2_45_18]|nr:MAG: Translation initiation factor IF-3 [Microgenomates group bacterium GW2011_GWF1_44_10]KKU01739.1 MAG: Translation initiation factor IF-3 [Microgenomates group bacterium GW2011_GWF2_45_18]